MVAELISYSHQVTICPDYVKKVIPKNWKYLNRKDFDTLYDLILTEKPRNIINLRNKPTESRCSIYLELTPVGFSPYATTLQDVKLAIANILAGLDWLHKRGFVHRDIRWDNVIREANGQFRLIDLEMAGREGVVDYVIPTWPALENSTYTKGVDLMMLDSMISRYDALLDRDAQEFRAKLTGHCTIEEVMKDPWLKNT